MSQHNKSRGPAFLLRSAAVLFSILGGGIAIWTLDQAITHPEIRAVQGNASAPLWIPLMLFVLAFTLISVLLFIRAARRVDAGEDLFARRHRKSPWEV